MPVYSGYGGRATLVFPIVGGYDGTNARSNTESAGQALALEAGLYTWQLRWQQECRPIYLSDPTRDVPRTAGRWGATNDAVTTLNLNYFPSLYAGPLSGELAISGHWDSESNPFDGVDVWTSPLFPTEAWSYVSFKLRMVDQSEDGLFDDGVIVDDGPDIVPVGTPLPDPNADRTAVTGRGRVVSGESSSSARGPVGFSLRIAVYYLSFIVDDRPHLFAAPGSP